MLALVLTKRSYRFSPLNVVESRQTMREIKLRPFFSYYGGKWRETKRYPEPRFKTIVEPFAGSVGYSLHFSHLKVILYERDEIVARVWKYLIEDATAEQILSIPDIALDGSVDDLRGYRKEVKWLVGFWLNSATTRPCRSPSKWMRSRIRPGCFWGKRVRETIAAQLPAIRHWKIRNRSFEQCPITKMATWFIDPPYQIPGKRYYHSSKEIDYRALAKWCRSRRGQVIVCEKEGAKWLNFKPLASVKTARVGRRSREAIWVNN